MAEPGDDWTDDEVDATVDDYLAMLRAELAGESYSKTQHRRALMALVSPERTEAAIEFKHQNISAVMIELGLPYIVGYRPAKNYQRALASAVQRRITTDSSLVAELQGVGGHVAGTPTGIRRADAPPPRQAARTARIIDFGALQEENRRVGALGEQLVVSAERFRLIEAGRPDLADRVRWVAREDGDGAGYDVLSFRSNDDEQFIEVKTTTLGAQTPFYLTSAELAFASEHQSSYAIHRVFDLQSDPKFFVIEGDLFEILELEPVSYRARLK